MIKYIPSFNVVSWEESLGSRACEQFEATLKVEKLTFIINTVSQIPEYLGHLEHKVEPTDESLALEMFGKKIAIVIKIKCIKTNCALQYLNN